MFKIMPEDVALIMASSILLFIIVVVLSIRLLIAERKLTESLHSIIQTTEWLDVKKVMKLESEYDSLLAEQRKLQDVYGSRNKKNEMVEDFINFGTTNINNPNRK